MRKFHDTYDEEETVWSLKPSVAPALNNFIHIVNTCPLDSTDHNPTWSLISGKLFPEPDTAALTLAEGGGLQPSLMVCSSVHKHAQALLPWGTLDSAG